MIQAKEDTKQKRETLSKKQKTTKVNAKYIKATKSTLIENGKTKKSRIRKPKLLASETTNGELADVR